MTWSRRVACKHAALPTGDVAWSCQYSFARRGDLSTLVYLRLYPERTTHLPQGRYAFVNDSTLDAPGYWPMVHVMSIMEFVVQCSYTKRSTAH